MGRILGSDGTCAHGYARELAASECPRCADRPPPAPVVVQRLPRTRWHRTDTTLGPTAKVAITFAIVVPFVTMTSNLRHAPTQPVYAFLVVPITGLVLFGVQFLPHLWEAGQLRRPRDDEPPGAEERA